MDIETDLKKIAAKIVRKYGKYRADNERRYRDLILQGRDPYEYGMLVENGYTARGAYQNDVLKQAVLDVLSENRS